MPHTIASLLDEYLASLRRSGRTEATLRAYHGDLTAAATALPQPLTALRREALEQWLGEATAASTQARRLASLRGFCAWCLAHAHLARDPTLGIEARSTTRRLPRPVKGTTDRRALDAAIAHYAMPERLIFTLLRETGMRVGEVLALNAGDVTLTPGTEGLHVRDPKNRVERVVALGPNSTERSIRLLRRHLKALGDVPATQPLFCSNRATRLRYGTVLYHWGSSAPQRACATRPASRATPSTNSATQRPPSCWRRGTPLRSCSGAWGTATFARRWATPR